MGTLEELEKEVKAIKGFLEYIYGPNITDDHQPPVTKPAEGFVKQPNGWNGNQDPFTWEITRMKQNNQLLKIVDNKGINIATDFTSVKTAQAYIDWNKSTDPGEQEPDEGPEPEKPKPDEPPQPAGSSTTKDGVQVPFEIEGNWDYKVTEDWRDGGARFNMECPGLSVVMVGSFIGKSGDDDVSPKLLMGRHTDDKGNDEHYMGCGYDGGIPVAGGDPRLRVEGPHNKYSDDLKKFLKREKADSCIGKFKLYMAAVIQEAKGVRFQMYQGKGNNEIKPSNDWTLIYDYLDDATEIKNIKKSGLDLKFFPIRNLDHAKGTEQSVWRVDETPGLKSKWLAVAKIKAKN